ncbi:hypothetical protein GCM10011412_06960 [Maribacter cobaltidurans]|nr:hypothetical protein GCM10011412_06960 [Maribacter cobaltidurans]
MEQRHISKYLMDIAPGLVIDNTETARTLLSTLIGGLISLMVFSFSMVMILLNQASSNFSPRVLPGIISNEKHQIVLGLYLAVILYNIFILVSIEPTKSNYQTPGFSVLIAIILTILCLAAFIYFIHNISQSIKVGTILNSIHLNTKNKLQNIIDNQEFKAFPSQENWSLNTIDTTGYFQGILSGDLLETCKNNDLKIVLKFRKGQFVLKGFKGLMTNKPISEEVKGKILKSLIFSSEELTGENYIYGFRQISEIGIKAMSPGINDPGTALNSIDYLTELFSLLMQINELEYWTDDKKALRVYAERNTFSEVLFNVLATYRPYCLGDIIVSQKLLYMLNILGEHVINSNQSEAIQEEIINIKKDLELQIKNSRDLTKIKEGFNSWS